MRLPVRPTLSLRLSGGAMTLGLAASFVLLIRVLSAAYLNGWTGWGAALLAGLAVAAVARHGWDLATGRSWRGALSGDGVAGRLAALERLHSTGRIRRAEYLEERQRILRGL